MNIDLTQVEAQLLLDVIEKTPVMGLEAMQILVLLACRLQDITQTEEK